MAERKAALQQVFVDHAEALMAQLDLESPADLGRRAAREEQRRRPWRARQPSNADKAGMRV